MPSFGLLAVETGATRTRDRATWSSSAATWANAVQMPWPYSTFPVLSVTSPFRSKSSQRASTGLAARSAGSEEMLDDTPDSAGGASDGPAKGWVPAAATWLATTWLATTWPDGGRGTAALRPEVRSDR